MLISETSPGRHHLNKNEPNPTIQMYFLTQRRSLTCKEIMASVIASGIYKTETSAKTMHNVRTARLSHLCLVYQSFNCLGYACEHFSHHLHRHFVTKH
ncbi:hypothetical protein ACN42_g10576 [Penicillium freii]|uniref:Uncharacterized protein n=1 Tax=Penicillium freii TaxID=48697 RepID=A0A117NKT8_PENFR|nr:hypothetical protein ACN42_g10576 [Penicillium freii]